MVNEFRNEYLNRSPNTAEKQQTLDLMKKMGFLGVLGNETASTTSHSIVWLVLQVNIQPLHLVFQILTSGFDESIPMCLIGAVFFGVLWIKPLVLNSYTINWSQRYWSYFLSDGIYPSWLIFSENISVSQQFSRREICK